MRLRIAPLLTSAAVFLLAAAPVGAQPQPAEHGAWVVLRGADTLAVETFTRTAERLEGELATRTPALRQRYAAELAPDGTAPTFHFAILVGLEGAPAPLADGVVEFRGDSALARVRAPGAPPEQRLPAGEGALPYVNLSVALLEQAVRRARVLGGDTVRVPLLAVQNGAIIPAVVTWPAADSARLALGPIAIHLVVDGAGRVTGASVPSQGVRMERVAGDGVRLGAAAPPDYSAPADAPYTAEDVRLIAPDGVALAGTLTLPKDRHGPVPAVLLLSGSGAQDRDQSIPILPGYRPFRQVADALGRRGIAVLRLDDRGVGGSGGSVNATTLAGFAADARAALEWLRERPEVDAERTAIVGHSEGGYVGPMVAAADPHLRALAVLAAPARTGRQLVDYQQEFLIGGDTTLAPAARDSLLAVARAASDSLAAASPWFGSLLAHDPTPAARTLRLPVLVLQGETDRQVPAAEAAALAAILRESGNRDVTMQVFPGLNHLFLPDPSGHPGGYATLPVRDVPDEVLELLAEWLGERLR